jgi:hypothetical protein
MKHLITWLAWAQAAYFILTGIWPIVDIKSFMAVTGPKRDLWLVRTVGAVVSAIGLALAIAAWTGEFPAAIFVLAVGSALALTAIDVIYVWAGAISKIYLLDAAAEIALVAGWAIFWLGPRLR